MLNKSPHLYGEWAVDLLWQKAVELWKEYYDQCEAFDEAKCSWRGRDGFALPVSREEQSKCTAFATRCYKDMMFQANDAKIPDETMRDARGHGLTYHESKWKKGNPTR